MSKTDCWKRAPALKVFREFYKTYRFLYVIEIPSVTTPEHIVDFKNSTSRFIHMC